MNFSLFYKKTALMLALACICVGLNAKPITREQAQARAAEFLNKVPGSRRLAPVTKQAKLGPRRAVAVTKADLDLYYVFNRGTNEGYVIASGDDQTLPVLGYTDSGQFDYDRLPDNMRSWLKDYENQLAQLREHPELMASAPRYAPLHDAIEPMITMGSKNVKFSKQDGWTCRTKDGKPAAHYEHTIAITAQGPEILSSFEFIESNN